MSMSIYQDRIIHLLAKMLALRPSIHPANRTKVEAYLHDVGWGVAHICVSFTPSQAAHTLFADKFQSYFDMQEEKILTKLRESRYDVDAVLAMNSGHTEQVSRLLIARSFYRSCGSIRYFSLWYTCSYRETTRGSNSPEPIYLTTTRCKMRTLP